VADARGGKRHLSLVPSLPAEPEPRIVDGPAADQAQEALGLKPPKAPRKKHLSRVDTLREECTCRGGPHGGFTCPSCRGGR
jgi:hypothetical protein